MLLQRLVEYSARIPSTPVMYQKTPIKWLVDINGSGKLQGIVPTSDGGKKNNRGKEFQAPHIGRAAGVKAKLLADNAEYVFGIARESSDPERVKECHAAFIELVTAASRKTGESAISAVCAFYDHTDIAGIVLPDGFNPADVLTFRVEGEIPFELPTVQRFWAHHTGAVESEESDTESSSDLFPCIVCGMVKPAVRRLPFKIKRIPNGQSAGNALISANSQAFESYGLEESLISPICSEDAEKFSKAANYLLDGEDTRLTVGPLAYIFWTKEDSGFSFATFLSKPDPAEVRKLIESAFAGREAALCLDDTAFYASAFSASGARVAVRDWLETTVGSVKRNLANYFRLQSIAELDGGDCKPMSIAALAGATVPRRQEKPDYDKLSPNVPKVLLKCALEGKPLPDWLLYQAVKRTKAEQRVLKGHAALIKMVLASHNNKSNQEGNDMEQLDLTNRDSAYLCGRLLGLLESLQYSSLGKTNSTIIGRYYGAASSAPASVFGTLLRGAQAHLDKLRKTKEGAYNALQQKLEEVQSGMTEFPKTLTLQQQGLFALGYYHQRAKDRADIAAHKQAKANESAYSNQ